MKQHQERINELSRHIKEAYQSARPLNIVSGNSKQFMGHPVEGETLDVSSLTGIIHHEPSELYITAYAGTSLDEIQSTLAKANQCLAFEPPAYSPATTIGGVAAAGLSGSARPFKGSVRDYILGVRCINGKGEELSFGGRVIKNVAGYDLTKLITASYGTLAVILEVTFWVVPKPQEERSFSIALEFEQSMQKVKAWYRQSYPITAAAYEDNLLKIRLSGNTSTLDNIVQRIAEELMPLENEYWRTLDNHQLDFFKTQDKRLWRLSVPNNTPMMALEGDCLVDWGGAQRWLKSNASAKEIRQMVEQYGGHADLIYGAEDSIERFHPLSNALLPLHQRLKNAFDPKAILNPGKMSKSL